MENSKTLLCFTELGLSEAYLRYKWNANTFAAWCRNKGAYKTKTRGYYNWNAEFLEPVIKDVTEVWHSFHEDLITSREKCISILAGMVDSIPEDLKGEQLKITPANLRDQ